MFFICLFFFFSGAAAQAAFLHGDKSEEISDLLWLDVTPLSIGIKKSDGMMSALIPRNTIIATEQFRQTFTTSSDLPTINLL